MYKVFIAVDSKDVVSKLHKRFGDGAAESSQANDNDAVVVRILPISLQWGVPPAGDRVDDRASRREMQRK